MLNLAGRDDCDQYIVEELVCVKIKVVRGERMAGEVPASITGILGPFVFERRWAYWAVKGPMPLRVAEELYADPIGKTDIRIAGHCGCPAPKKP